MTTVGDGTNGPRSTPWSLVPRRSDSPELLDGPGIPEDQIASAYRVLRRVNRQLGNLRAVRREATRFLDEDLPGVTRRCATALDVGSGSGDVSAALAPRLVAFSLDRDPTAAALAGRAGIPVVRGEALNLPFADASIDLVTAVKFAHHFSGRALDRLLGEMARVARRRVVVLDIRRHWVAYGGFFAWSRVFTRNRLVRHDGLLSVLRGFTAGELAQLGSSIPEFEWTVRSYPGFQLALVGRRKVAAS